MNLNHLTDQELIQYIIKHDTDPIRVRLAMIMDNMPGRIIDGLERAGMDPETCMHENIYESGEYILHLKNEIDYLEQELYETQGKLAERMTLSVSGLIEELHAKAWEAQRQAEVAHRELNEYQGEVERTRAKMKVWRAISTDVS